MVKNIALHIVFLLLSVQLFGQNEFVELDINPKDVEIGQSVIITLKTNVDGDLDMSLPDEFIQSGAMQTGMSSSIEYVNGRQKAIRYNYRTFTGYFEDRSEEHTSELQSRPHLVCRLLLEKKKKKKEY